MAAKQIKIHGKDIIFSDWEQIGFSGSVIRKIYPDDMINRVILKKFSTPKKQYLTWHPMFWGSNLRCLEEIYHKIHPKPPEFRKHQLLEAQQHVDKFFDQVNSLAAFI